MTRTRHGEDEGQVTLVLILVVLVFFGLALGITKFGEASDVRTGAQKGADAAALGAAVAARDAAILLVPTPAGFGALESGAEQLVLAAQAQSVGCGAAGGWASSNSAVLTACGYRPSGSFSVRTRSNPSNERRLVGTATATADLHLPTCVMVRVETMAGETETVTCTGLRGTAVVVYHNGVFVSMSPQQAWQSAFHLRLTK